MCATYPPPSRHPSSAPHAPGQPSTSTMLARLSVLFPAALAACALFASSATAAVQQRDSQSPHPPSGLPPCTRTDHRAAQSAARSTRSPPRRAPSCPQAPPKVHTPRPHPPPPSTDTAPPSAQPAPSSATRPPLSAPSRPSSPVRPSPPPPPGPAHH